jgi:LmbE family N-acetylglucosaminyl deacetylase
MIGLVLVAHPDDEVLFAGELLLQHPQVEWDVLCMTYRDDHPRGQRFGVSMECFAARGCQVNGNMAGLPDNDGMVLSLSDYARWRSALREHVAGMHYDFAITHNRLGEYGHGHHMALHNIAKEVLLTDHLWFFYGAAPTSVGPQERLQNLRSIRNSGGKKEIMKMAYPSEYEGLMYHMPRLVGEQLEGVDECYTSDGAGWPL